MTDEKPPRRPRSGIVKEIMTDPQPGKSRPTKPDPRGRALLLPVAGAGALLWLAPRDPILASLAAATVAAIVLLSRVPLTGMGLRTGRLYRYFMRISAVIAAVALIDYRGAALPVGGAWLLAGVAVGACGVLVSQRGELPAD